MIAYGLTIFLGAFLLFQVQPLMGKYILPWFGGSPGVWTTCLLFFQSALLAGYAYAHFSAQRLTPKRQAGMHVALLILALALLPIIPAESWKPQAPGDPTLRILALLAVNLGVPYLVLAATGPLIQHWCSRTHPGTAPYRLYALSNTGSLLALVSYPFYFEWAFPRTVQARGWSWTLAAFALACGYCAVRAARQPPPLAPAAAPASPAGPPPSWSDRLLWLILPAVASILLLATTNKLCQDLAVTPFLWVLPLSLYLVTFILCFDHPRWYHRGFWSLALVLAIALAAELLSDVYDFSLPVQALGYAGALFAGCMFCHGELFRLRPDPRRLTGFYLAIAAGGAAGGFLVAVVAPVVFHTYLELPLSYWALSALLAVVAVRARSRALALGAAAGALCALLVIPAAGAGVTGSWPHLAAAAVRASTAFTRAHPWSVGAVALAAVAGLGDPEWYVVRQWRPRAALFLAVLCCGVGRVFIVELREARTSVVSATRNFFGVLTVFEYFPDQPLNRYDMLEHGKIIHGLQFADPYKAGWPTTYYGETSGVGLAIRTLPPAPGRRIGLVGLGTGTLAAYGRKGDSLRIYEINPQVEALARTRFTYLARCAAQVTVVLGDARLSLERELARGERQQFDLLALDAFNSDAIPVHLLTQEAFAVYLQHLKPDGVIAVHISNQYFDLEPVVTNLARHFGLACVTISDEDESQWWVYGTTWMLVAKNPDRLNRPIIVNAADVPEAADAHPPPLWTDDYTSLFKILR